MEDKLLKKQLPEALNDIKNVNKKRATVDRLLSHLKKMSVTNWDQESINDMTCILQCKCVINDNLARNEEVSTNYDDIARIRILP